MIIVIVLLIIFLFLATISFQFIGDYLLVVYVIKGIMLGSSYDCEEITEEGVKEHTLQICIVMICFTFIWDTPLNK